MPHAQSWRPLRPLRFFAALKAVWYDTQKAARLKRFLDAQERLTVWPAKLKDKLLVLEYLASRFEWQRTYHEKEVNAVLNEWHTFGDWALLRRYLCDYGFFNRQSDGSAYWRVAEDTRSDNNV
jgi:hypothetical protein